MPARYQHYPNAARLGRLHGSVETLFSAAAGRHGSRGLGQNQFRTGRARQGGGGRDPPRPAAALNSLRVAGAPEHPGDADVPSRPEAMDPGLVC